MLNTQCVRQSPPASQIRVVSYLVPWLFSLFWPQCAHTQSNPFYHPFYPDVTHVRKDIRPSPALPNCKRRKAGRGLGTRLSCPYCSSIHCTMGGNGRTGLYPVLTVHPSTVLWEGMDGLGYTLFLLFIHPLYYGREWMDWVIPCSYCSSIHCTMGENGRTGLYLLFIHPLYYGREWTDWVILTVHPSTVLWEGMDGLGYTLFLLFIHPLYYGREWMDWVIPCSYCSSIHCTMGGNGWTGLYPVLTVHPSTVLWERMDGLGYTLSLLFIHPLYYGREWVCLWCVNVQLGDLGSLRLSRVTSQTHR